MAVLVLCLLAPQYPLGTNTVTCRLSSTRAVIISLLCTTSDMFDVPVYWPILVVYFCVLFALTMRRQIQYVESPATLSFAHIQPFQTYDQIQIHTLRYRSQGTVRWEQIGVLRLPLVCRTMKKTFFAIHPVDVMDMML